MVIANLVICIGGNKAGIERKIATRIIDGWDYASVRWIGVAITSGRKREIVGGFNHRGGVNGLVMEKGFNNYNGPQPGAA